MPLQNYTFPLPKKQPLADHVNLSLDAPHVSTSTTKTKIARQTGKHHLLENAPLKPRKLDISRINSSSEASETLQFILDKIDSIAGGVLIKNDQISEIAGQITQLERSLARMKTEGSLSQKEVSDFQFITQKMRMMLGSIEEWVEFHSEYLKLDQKREDSLAVASSTLFSDLHGCSPMAINGIKEAMETLHQLTKHATVEIAKNTPYSAEVEKELRNSTHSTWFNTEDACEAVIANINQLTNKALSSWDEANSTLAKEGFSPSLETLCKLQEASALLLSLEETLQEWTSSVGKLKILTSACSKDISENASALDSKESLQMKKQLELISQAFTDIQQQLPEKQKAFKKAIHQRQVKTTSHKVAFVDSDLIANRIQNAITRYSQHSPDPNEKPEQAIKRYVAFKRELIGLLSISPEARKFIRAEEKRLNKIAGYVEDFDGLVYAKILKEQRAERGWLTRAIARWHPENWSETTKKWVYTGLTALQLSDKALNINKKLPVHTVSNDNNEAPAQKKDSFPIQATVQSHSERSEITETLAANAIHERVISAKDPAERLMDSSKVLNKAQRDLNQCNLVEYMQPKGEPVSFKEQETLRNEVAHMHSSLRATMAVQPKQSPSGPEWARWDAAVNKQCFDVRDLEKRVENAMQAYHEARALRSLQYEEEALSVFGNKHLNLIKQTNLQSF